MRTMEKAWIIVLAIIGMNILILHLLINYQGYARIHLINSDQVLQIRDQKHGKKMPIFKGKI
jgi:hypothetical protein